MAEEAEEEKEEEKEEEGREGEAVRTSHNQLSSVTSQPLLGETNLVDILDFKITPSIATPSAGQSGKKPYKPSYLGG